MKVNGVVLTGWSRFSHKQPLCETLPASIPSLAFCLLAGERSDQSPENIIKYVTTELGFSKSTDFELHLMLPNATFPGNEVYKLSMVIDGIKMLTRPVNRMLQTKNPSKEIFQKSQATLKVFYQYASFLTDTVNSFNKYLFENSIKELFETKIKNILPYIKTSISGLNKFIQRESGITNHFSQTIDKDIKPYNGKPVNSKTSRVIAKEVKTKTSLTDQKLVKSKASISNTNPVLDYVNSNLKSINQSFKTFKKNTNNGRINDRLENMGSS